MNGTGILPLIGLGEKVTLSTEKRRAGGRITGPLLGH